MPNLAPFDIASYIKNAVVSEPCGRWRGLPVRGVAPTRGSRPDPALHTVAAIRDRGPWVTSQKLQPLEPRHIGNVFAIASQLWGETFAPPRHRKIPLCNPARLLYISNIILT